MQEIAHAGDEMGRKNSFKYLEQFENLNTAAEIIHDLGDGDVLIILKDGTNMVGGDYAMGRFIFFCLIQ